jgi:hypothetical protein
MLRWLLVIVSIAIAAPASAADLAGRWVLRADDTVMMTFDITNSPHGWLASWERPRHFESDGETFTRVAGPVIRRTAKSVRTLPDGVELTFDDPAPHSIPDVFVIRLRDKNTAEVKYDPFWQEPATLARVASSFRLGGWDAGRRYALVRDRPTNAEMTAIFNADQAARSRPGPIDWKVVSAADEARRVRTQALLDTGQLHSGDDFYHAAFVFQHGQESADYLKAHALAVISAARGKSSATWIAAATLDRYLRSIGQPQVYGTQYSKNGPDSRWTQQPYQAELLSDALREATRVPPRSKQLERLRQFEQEEAATKP